MRGAGILAGPRARITVAAGAERCPTFPWLLEGTGCEVLRRRFAAAAVAVARAQRLAQRLRGDGVTVLLSITDDARAAAPRSDTNEQGAA